MPVPYWTCEICKARLYSASDALRWRNCPVCDGNLVLLGDHPSGKSPGRQAASEPEPRGHAADDS
jgi:hypothetical protein